MNLLLIVTTVLLLMGWSDRGWAQEADSRPVVENANKRTVAQSEESSARPRAERKQTLNFEDELVEGSAQKPELFYLFQKKNFNYKRLIKLRENFLPEMRRTSEDIQRLRGGR